MTHPTPSDPRPQLTMTRVSSGGAARRGIALMAGLLVLIVGFVVVNRPPPATAPAPTRLPVVAVPTVGPSPTASCNRRHGPAPTPGPFDQFAVGMEIKGGRLRAVLEPKDADVYVGTLKIESAALGPTLGIELGWQRHLAGPSRFEPFGAWDVALEPVQGSHGTQVEMLVAQVRPLAELPVRFTLVPNGYTFTVLGRRSGRYVSLRFELLWPPAAPLAANVGPAGDDGVGCLKG